MASVGGTIARRMCVRAASSASAVSSASRAASSRRLAGLAGRVDIPGAAAATFPAVSAGSSLELPRRLDAARLTAPDGQPPSVQTLGKLIRPQVERWLYRYGAVHLVNSPLASPEDFGALMLAMSYKAHDYTGGTGFRSATKVKDVVSASDEPPNFTIELHSEKSDNATYPKKVIFFCVLPAEEGGETPLVHSRDILRDLDSSLLERLETKNICYIRFLKDKNKTAYMSWQGAFQTNTKSEVNQFLTDLDYTYEWTDGDSLSFWKSQPATRIHPITGEKVWFNSVQSHHESYFYAHPRWRENRLAGDFPLTTMYGDHTPIEAAALQHIREVTWNNVTATPMRANEVMFIDNMLVQHGRMAFKGARKMMAYLSD